MTHDRTELLIRAALTEEADRRPDPARVLAQLEHRSAPSRRTPVLVAVAALVVVVAVAVVLVPRALHRGEPVVGAAPAAEENVLLVGLDDIGYADSVVLGHFGRDGTASFASIPRDSYVDIPGVGKGKLNSAYAAGRQAALNQGHDEAAADEAGARTLADTVGQLTGTHVDHYGIVPMASFGSLSSAVGGVPVCLRAAAHDPMSGASFPAGQQVVEGQSALAFLRQRHGLPKGDLDRVVRLQVFLRGLVDKALSGNLLTDAQRLASLLDIVRADVRTDPGWDLLAFAAQLSGVHAVKTGTIPVADGELMIPGTGAVIGLDPAQVRAYVADLPHGPRRVRTSA